MKSITDYMTDDEANAYSFAASLAAGNVKNRAAWAAAVCAIRSAKEKAIAAWGDKPVKLNRNGQPYGRVHPAIKELDILPINGCYAPD